MPRTKTIHDTIYKGYRINSARGGCRDSWLNHLINLSRYALAEQREPKGYVLSFELGANYTIQNALDNLNYYFQRSVRREGSPVKPLYAWKHEVKMLKVSDAEYDQAQDPDRPYSHYHMALVLDGKQVFDKAIRWFLHSQQQAGVIHQYHLSKHGQTGHVSKDLRIEFDDWIYHASYLAKIDTAAPGRCFNTSRLSLAS